MDSQKGFVSLQSETSFPEAMASLCEAVAEMPDATPYEALKNPKIARLGKQAALSFPLIIEPAPSALDMISDAYDTQTQTPEDRAALGALAALIS